VHWLELGAHAANPLLRAQNAAAVAAAAAAAAGRLVFNQPNRVTPRYS